MEESEISTINFEPSKKDSFKKPVMDGDPCCSLSSPIEVLVNPEEIFVKQESFDNDSEEFSTGTGASTLPISTQSFISDYSNNSTVRSNSIKKDYSEDPLLPSGLLNLNIDIAHESLTKLSLPAKVSSENISIINANMQEITSNLKLPSIPPGLAINQRKKLPEFLNGFLIFQLNDYLGYGTRQQFWEEPGIKKVLDGIQNGKIDMKIAAEILGVSYNMLYGRYRKENFKTIKEVDVCASRSRKMVMPIYKETIRDEPSCFYNLESSNEYKNKKSNEKHYSKLLKQNIKMENSIENESSKILKSIYQQGKPLQSRPKHSSPSITASTFIQQKKEFFNFLRNSQILRLNEYMNFPNHTKSQFFEQDYVRTIMEAVRNTFIDMKRAAKILGVTYHVLYPKYIEVYGNLKSSRPNIERRRLLSNRLPKDILEQLEEPPSKLLCNYKTEKKPTVNRLNLCNQSHSSSLQNEYLLPVPLVLVPESNEQNFLDSTYNQFQNLRFDLMENKKDSMISSSSQAKRKKTEYNRSFQESWKTRLEYRDWIIQIDNAFAKCKLCNISFTVKHDGEKALKTHLGSNRHIANAKSMVKNQHFTTFMQKKDPSKQFQVSIAELMQVYHGINHHHNLLSIDCGIKLNNNIFNDSKLSKGINCGRTRVDKLVKNVLWQNSIEFTLRELQGNCGANFTNFNCIPFSITTDAFNKGNINLFPIAVTYFDIETGIKNKIIDFYETSSDTQEEISDKIKSCLEKNGLDISNVSSYTVENASVNYEINEYIFQKLSMINEDIFKVHNYSNIIHNAARTACKMLTYDVENLIIKVFSEFSNCAIRISGFKDFFEFLDMNYEDIIGQSPVKYLSLYHTVEQLVKSWPAIKSYFINLGKNDCSKVIWSFIEGQSKESKEDSTSYFTIPELYIYFVYYYMSLMTKTLQSVESNSMTCLELHDVLFSLVNSIENRIQKKFFGNKIQFALQHCNYSFQEKDQFVKEALDVYSRTRDYLKKWFDFQNNPFQYFTVLNLKINEINYSEVLQAVQHAKVVLDEDSLFDEVQNLNALLPTIIANMPNLSVAQKWVAIFKGFKNFKELPKLLTKVLSLPVNNSFTESFFSQMKDILTDKTNREALDLAKAGLCAKVNFDMTCEEFSDYVKQPAQINLLQSAFDLTISS